MTSRSIHPLAKVAAIVLVSALVGFGAYRAVSADPAAPPPPEHHDPGEELGPTTYLPAVQGGASDTSQSDKDTLNTLYTLKVYVSTPGDIAALTSSEFDILEARGENYLLAQGTSKEIAQLRAKGYRVEIMNTLNPVPEGVAAMTYYGGYRTVAEHYAHLDSVASSYPGLVSVYDYGDSWRKINSLPNGHDLRVMCITNKSSSGGDCSLNLGNTKPRFLMVAAIHARELTTAEMAWRWIDYLVQNYNVDADVTTLLDHNELWVVPTLNPDGRQIVELGGNNPYTQRKNARDTGNCSYPPTSSSQDGVDLNRNASTDNYGGAGTSTAVCNLTYRGAGPASEPEQAAFETLAAQLFPDTKGPGRNDPAATNTKGSFLTLHTYSNLVLLPYGDATTGGYAPNDAALRSLAFRMSFYNNYRTGTGDEILYATTGTTDDWVYGKLGVPGFTFEIGPETGTCSGFTPAYTCQDGTFWPLNRPAFLYAAKNAREPYITPFGPTSSALSLSASSVTQGTNVTLNANLNDNAYGNASGSVGRPATQNIAAGEYYIDTPPWSGGTAVAMSASDGSFNTNNENVTASINTSSLSAGRHTLFVRGRDASNNWGAVSAIFLTVTVAGPTPTPTNTPTPGPTPTPTNTPLPTNTPTPGPSIVFSDNFETNLGWTANPGSTDTAVSGQWERGDPEGTTSGSRTLQLNTTFSGVNDLVTGRLAGSSAGAYDVDGGVTSIRSPNITLPGTGNLTLTLRYYLAHLSNATSADYLRVRIVGNTTTTVLETLGAASNRNGAWTASSNISLNAYAGQTIYILIECADAGSASLIEAGIDDVLIQQQ
jgi:murein tripeptide amidase MpaA